MFLYSSATHFQIGFLSVVEAPDILYNETSNDTIVPEGYDVNLRCEARGFPEPTVTWRREGGALIALRGNEDAGKTVRGELSVSTLISTLSMYYFLLEIQPYALKLKGKNCALHLSRQTPSSYTARFPPKLKSNASVYGIFPDTTHAQHLL